MITLCRAAWASLLVEVEALLATVGSARSKSLQLDEVQQALPLESNFLAAGPWRAMSRYGGGLHVVH